MVPTDISVAVSNALAEQPWFIRRKDTIAAVAGTILQACNLLAVIGSGWPEWAGLIVAIVVGIAQILIHAATKGAITPSMATRLEKAMPTQVETTLETYSQARDRLARPVSGLGYATRG